jgi:hypothetical protein
MDEKEVEAKLSKLTWLIDRYDVLRVAISRRAAIVLSADAILVTATIFIFGKFAGGIAEGTTTITSNERILILIIIVLSLTSIALLLLSLLMATYSIINVWSTSQEIHGEGAPDMIFFHARDTYEKLENFPSFKNRLDTTTDEEFLTYAEAELWRVTVATYYRHGDLKKSIRYLFFAIFPFFLTLLVYSVMLANMLF